MDIRILQSMVSGIILVFDLRTRMQDDVVSGVPLAAWYIHGPLQGATLS